MKIKNLIQARRVIASKAEEPVSVKLAYKMMKFIKASSDEGAFYNEKIRGVIEKYGEKDADGNLVIQDNGVKVRDEYIAECQTEISAIEETDVECNVKFTLTELEELKLSMNEIFALDTIITEEV